MMDMKGDKSILIGKKYDLYVHSVILNRYTCILIHYRIHLIVNYLMKTNKFKVIMLKIF